MSTIGLPLQRKIPAHGQPAERKLLMELFMKAMDKKDVETAAQAFVANIEELYSRDRAPMERLLKSAPPEMYARLCLGIAGALSKADNIGLELWHELLDCSRLYAETAEMADLYSKYLGMLTQAVNTHEDSALVARAIARNVGKDGVPSISQLIDLAPDWACPSLCDHLVKELSNAGVVSLDSWIALLRGANERLPSDYKLQLVSICSDALRTLNIACNEELGHELASLVPHDANVEQGLAVLAQIATLACVDVAYHALLVVNRAALIVGRDAPDCYGTVVKMLMKRGVDRNVLGLALLKVIRTAPLDKNSKIAVATKQVLKRVHLDELPIIDRVRTLVYLENGDPNIWSALLKQANLAPYTDRIELIWECSQLSGAGLVLHPQCRPIWADLLNSTLANADYELQPKLLLSLFNGCRSCEEHAGAAKALALAISSPNLYFYHLLDLLGENGANLPGLVNLLVKYEEQTALGKLFQRVATIAPDFHIRLDFVHIAKAFVMSKLPSDLESWESIVKLYASKVPL